MAVWERGKPAAMQGTVAGAGAPDRVADTQIEADDAALPSCAGGESFALMVLGHSMAPEFNEGEIVIIEPEGLAHDGSYVLAHHQGEWTFRQLNPTFADQALADLSAVRGVIIQKSLPGRRRASKRYI